LADRHNQGAMETRFNLADRQDSSITIRTMLADAGGTWQQQRVRRTLFIFFSSLCDVITFFQRVWASGRYNKRLESYQWNERINPLTRVPDNPFYYDVGDLLPKPGRGKLCLAQCMCKRKRVPSATTEMATMIRAHCKNDRYHAICARWAKVSDCLLDRV